MTFGEKLRTARQSKGLTQAALAKETGISLRTIQNYELDARMPGRRGTYARLAAALGVDEQVFRDDNMDFILAASARYGSRGLEQAWGLVRDFRGLAAGGEIGEEDLDEVMRAIQDAYWDAKELNRKYASPRSRQEDGGAGA